jgi:hypothetical protein
VRGRLRAPLGALALASALAVSLLVAAGAASRPSTQVPASKHGFPEWLRGPLRWLDAPALTSQRFALLLAGLLLTYLIALACAGAIRPSWAVAGIVAVHVVFALGPPLLSGDAFSYLQYARMGPEHGLNPYEDPPSAIAGDPAYRFASEHRITSPYGPLFTLLCYPLVPLGVPAAFWILKALTAGASLGIVALVWRGSDDPVLPALLVGLNPLVTLYAVGGAHNDLPMMLLAVVAVVLVGRGREAAGGAVLTAAAAVKATAGLLLPFAVAGEPRRLRLLAGAVAAAVAGMGVTLLAFGPEALNLVDVLGSEQQRRSTGSVPRALSRILGEATLHEGVRLAAAVAFAVAVVALLVLVARRVLDWVTGAGWAMLALLVTTAWLLPWYGVWLMPLAALSRSRWLQLAAVGFTVALVASKVVPGLR